MEIIINHKLKVVEFWLKKEEEIQDIEIKAIKEKYCVEKYRAVVYHSGNARLIEEIRKLILHNRTLQKGQV